MTNRKKYARVLVGFKGPALLIFGPEHKLNLSCSGMEVSLFYKNMEYKRYCAFLTTCQKTIKKASSGEAINALFWVLNKNEDSYLVKLDLNRSEKDILVKEYNKIFTQRGKKKFWNNLNSRMSLATV